jgi:peroxiredoxin 2/4
MAEAQCIRFPAPEEPLPDFEAEITHGSIKLPDLKGKWVVLPVL